MCSLPGLPSTLTVYLKALNSVSQKYWLTLYLNGLPCVSLFSGFLSICGTKWNKTSKLCIYIKSGYLFRPSMWSEDKDTEATSRFLVAQAVCPLSGLAELSSRVVQHLKWDLFWSPCCSIEVLKLKVSSLHGIRLLLKCLHGAGKTQISCAWALPVLADRDGRWGMPIDCQRPPNTLGLACDM